MANEFAKRALGRAGLLNSARALRTGLKHTISRAEWRIRGAGLLETPPLIPEDAFSDCCDRVIAALDAKEHVFGDYLEFGVSRGTSLRRMSEALLRAGHDDVRLIGFDSFEGLPQEAAEEGWVPGSFRSNLAVTERYLGDAGVRMNRVSLIKGWFTDTLNQETVHELELRRASIMMLDCDLYSATRDALAFVKPLIGDEAVLIFDDWGWKADYNEIGQQEAFAEFESAFPGYTFTALDPYIPQARVFMMERKRGTSH